MSGTPWHKKLHWRILAGLVLGIIYGVAAAAAGWVDFTADWISPFGTIFVNLLKLIAIPLVLSSLVCGVASLSDLRKLSRIGGKTIAIYITTTAIAVSIGLIIVNVVKPGAWVPQEMRDRLQQVYQEDVTARSQQAEVARQRGPLQPIVDMVPQNFFGAASDNRNMLQVVFFAILLGVGLTQVSKEKARPLLGFFEGLNLVIIRLVDLIMLLAPFGVFALIAGTITEVTEDNPAGILELLAALGMYCATVLLGLGVHMIVTYGLILRLLTPLSLGTFYRAMVPAQLLAFSTSSSAATLPVTMERAEEKLGVSEEVSSFVLPARSHGEHGWHGSLSGCGSCLHRRCHGPGTGLHGAADHCPHGCSCLHWHGGSPQRRDHHAGHHSRGDWCARGGYCPDSWVWIEFLTCAEPSPTSPAPPP